MVSPPSSPSNPNTETNSDIEKAGNEKTAPIAVSEEDKHDALIDEAGYHGAHMLDASQLADPNLKTTADGKTILIPQPSSDPHDPLNWTYAKKHIILTIISIVAFMPDFGSSMGIITLLPQALSVPPVLHVTAPL